MTQYLPDCDTPQSQRQPDHIAAEWFLKIADQAIGHAWRENCLIACVTRGGPELWAAELLVEFGTVEGDEELQRIANAYGIPAVRPTGTRSELITATCYLIGLSGLPITYRRRAAAKLSGWCHEAGYREARRLLPKNGWSWIAQARSRRESWVSNISWWLLHDTAASPKDRLAVALAMTDPQEERRFVLEVFTQLIADPKAPSKMRLQLAERCVDIDPAAAAGLLQSLAADDTARRTDRKAAIDVLLPIDPQAAVSAQALVASTPTRDSHPSTIATTSTRSRQSTSQTRALQRDGLQQRLDMQIAELTESLAEWGRGIQRIDDRLDENIADYNFLHVQEDIGELQHIAHNHQVAFEISMLDRLIAMRDDRQCSDLAPWASSAAPNLSAIPRLTAHQVEHEAEQAYEQSLGIWRESVARYGWDDEEDTETELTAAQVEARTEARNQAVEVTGNHLRALFRWLYDDQWPQLVRNAAAGHHDEAQANLKTVQAGAKEASTAYKLWEVALNEVYTSDPAALGWVGEMVQTHERWLSTVPQSTTSPGQNADTP